MQRQEPKSGIPSRHSVALQFYQLAIPHQAETAGEAQPPDPSIAIRKFLPTMAKSRVDPSVNELPLVV